jgi:hypothetical protein
VSPSVWLPTIHTICWSRECDHDLRPAKYICSYTPDFASTLTEAAIQLHAHQNQTPWTYYVGASVPSHLVSVCQRALPRYVCTCSTIALLVHRPYWEPLLYYMVVCVMTVVFVCVLAGAFLEGDRVITCAYRALRMSNLQPSINFRPFDLNRLK